MIVTGATLYDLYRSAKKPVKKIEEVYTAHVEYREANPNPIHSTPILSRKRFNIDIPVDETVLPDYLMGNSKAEPVKEAEKAVPAASIKETPKEEPKEEVAPSVISFQKAKEQREQYISSHQKAEENGSIEDLLPPAMKTPEDAPKEKKKDPIIEALINKAVQPPKLSTEDNSFSRTLSEQEKVMSEITDKKIISDLIQPVTDSADGKETLDRYAEELDPSHDEADGIFPETEEEDDGFHFDFNDAKTAVSRPKLTLVENLPQEKTIEESDEKPALDEEPELASDGEVVEMVTQLEESVEEEEEPYTPPPVELLNDMPQTTDPNLQEELRINAEKLVDTLRSFGVQTRIVDIARGPAVTRYELQPSAGVKISKITGLADDIALNLAASGVRIEAPIPNKPAVGIEVPNKVVSTVSIREVIDSDEFRDAKSKLSVALGRDIAGKITIADLAKMPHTLIAGATGSGKSVCINSLIVSILYKATPDEVKLLMVDPKMVELGIYNGIPHLLVPVVTDPKKAAGALAWAVNEMLNRYQMFKDYGVRDLAGFNRMAPDRGLKTMPQIVIIIDELADLMMAAPGEVEDSIFRLAQMARAAGMYLVIATQRPSVDVITGVIKANIQSRIDFAVSSQIDSRTILDASGAEKLLGRGDMLFSPVGATKPLRVQGCFVTDAEVERIITFIKESQKKMTYDEKIMEEIERQAVTDKDKKKGGDKDSGGGFMDEDEMLPSAIECVIDMGQASTSLLQRKLKLGYARAARIMDMMEEKGIIGPYEGSKPRQVLISKERWIEMKMIAQAKAEDERRNY
ncbi:MAG: DNA translocase FtsK [Oscillospiraceae bacterium]|nr:DNA translocase FtsK [Oscillospiraceae bacterium]